MKSLFIAALLITLNLFSQAQHAGSPDKSLQQLLNYYYELKNALVKDDANAASESAGKLLSTIKALDIKTLNTSEQKAFTSVKEKLVYNADHISEVNDLSHQREHFAALSEAMSILAQSVQLSPQPVYLDFCPMKKTYWLSNEKAIQNPYYGKAMPGCGNVIKTLSPGKEHSMQRNDETEMNNSMSMDDKKGKDSMAQIPSPLERARGEAMNMNDTVPKDKMQHDMSNMHMNDTMPMDHMQHDMKNNQMTDPGMHMNNMSGMDMNNMSHSFSLNFPMSRNGSGTGWSPDASPMYGHMYHSKNWMYMLHYNLFIRYNKQDLTDKGIRGSEMVDAPNWLMFMGQRKVGENGLFNFSTMFSLDAIVTGQRGYPLLFQSGESAHGISLVDRQHPHDLFSELSVAYSYAFSKKVSAFAYIGYPGEPALGPVAFMHRASALYNPDAPITHHWIDATHITFGVATVGVMLGNFKLEGSSFTGREADENRYDLDKPRFDSWSGRLSFNPSKNWALQFSHAYIKSPEALHPGENIHRTTASAQYSLRLQNNTEFNATAVWGMNKLKNENGENAFLLEVSYRLNKLALFGKYEYVQKSTEELSLDEGFYGNTLFPVNAYTFGFNYDLLHVKQTRVAIGSHFTLYSEDKKLYSLYGKNPTAFEVYLRIYPGRMKM